MTSDGGALTKGLLTRCLTARVAEETKFPAYLPLDDAHIVDPVNLVGKKGMIGRAMKFRCVGSHQDPHLSPPQRHLQEIRAFNGQIFSARGSGQGVAETTELRNLLLLYAQSHPEFNGSGSAMNNFCWVTMTGKFYSNFST